MLLCDFMLLVHVIINLKFVGNLNALGQYQGDPEEQMNRKCG